MYEWRYGTFRRHQPVDVDLREVELILEFANVAAGAVDKCSDRVKQRRRLNHRRRRLAATDIERGQKRVTTTVDVEVGERGQMLERDVVFAAAILLDDVGVRNGGGLR